MKSITIEDLIDCIRTYNEEEIDYIMKAYELANELHKSQVRQSGEPYIIHPLSVALILAEMKADKDTICAALLHDVIEDSDITKEEIAEMFNQDIANLVDGVTKISKLKFSSKQEQNLANTRKIIVSLTTDVRIIIIKLADRLHNMRTLQFKSEYKQKENAIETMELYVPLAYEIGAYRIKSELEDLSFRYIDYDSYKQIEEEKIFLEKDSNECLQEMEYKIKTILEKKEIPSEIKIRTKNIYGIYKRKNQEKKVSDIHDLLALKIMVDEIENCYRTLGVVHSIYNPINNKFKDYLFTSKTNGYRSLHTTVFGPNDKLVQTQIRTFDMDTIASFGLTAYWNINKGEARIIMQKDLKEKYQFFPSLNGINDMFIDNQDFVDQIKKELLSEKIYVYTCKGKPIELPKGSTPIDFAYKIRSELGDSMFGAFVNDEMVPVDYILNNKDRVKIITNEILQGPREDWTDKAHTSYAKRKIREFINN